MGGGEQLDKLNELLGTKIYISRVFIHGLSRTKDDFAKRVSKSLFDAETFADFYDQAVNVRGLFRDFEVASGVQITLDAGNSNKDFHAHIRLKERNLWSGGVQGFMANAPDGNAGLGGGVTIQGVLLNMFGRAEKLSCCWSKGTLNAAQEIRLKKPCGEGLSSLLSADVFSRFGEVPLSGFNQTENGLALNYTMDLPFGNHKLSYEGSWRKLMPRNDSTSLAVREHAGHSLKSSIKYELSYDTRDDAILPSSGGFCKIIQELAGLGGDTHFYSKSISGQYNQELLFDRVVLQLNASAGHVQSLNFLSNQTSKQLSIIDKFFLGGPTSLRGFDSKGVGPRQKNDSLGSDFYWLASAHLKLPLLGLSGAFADRFRLQAFVNCGNAADWVSGRTLSQHLRQNRETARLSYGFGIMANFLGARLELNYCFPVWYQTHDMSRQGFQFGISVGD